MSNRVIELSSPANWWSNLLLKLLRQTKSMCINPASLFRCHKQTSKLFFLLDLIEVIHNNTDEQVENELTTKDHEDNEVEHNDW